MASVRKKQKNRVYSNNPAAIRKRIARQRGRAGKGKDWGHYTSLKKNKSSSNTRVRRQSKAANRAAGGKSGNRRGKASGGRKGSSAAKRRAGRMGGRKSRGGGRKRGS